MSLSLPKLSKLEKVPLRDIWAHEAHSFTQWLALPENLEQLGEAIGIELIECNTEVAAGPFWVDIVATDSVDRKVVIENQLEATDHDHLGKIITYAAVHKAEVIVWIVKDAREQHEQAINWLNDNTGEDINIFLIRLGAVRIGNSSPAPIFDVIAKPNELVKHTRGEGNAELHAKRADFWRCFTDLYESKKSISVQRVTKPSYKHYVDIKIRTIKNAHITATVTQSPDRLGVGIYIPDDKELYFDLFDKKDRIEKELGVTLQWRENENKKATRITTGIDIDFTKALDQSEESYREEIINWLSDTANRFADIFSSHLS